MSNVNALRIGNVVTGPSSRNSGLLEVGWRPDGSLLGLPFHVIQGAKSGPTLCIDACTHGDEVEGALAVMEFIREINPNELSGAIVCVPVLNIPAFEAGQRGAYPGAEVTLFDMNRIMPGSASESITLRLAHIYFDQIVKRSDIVISLHSGGLQQYQTARIIYQRGSTASLELAKALGPSWSILQEGIPSEGSTEKVAEALGKPCVITELGGAAERFPHAYMDNVRTIVSSLQNVLKYYHMMPGTPDIGREWIRVESKHSLFCTRGGLMVPLPAMEMKRRAASGTPLMRILDLLGREVEVIQAPYDGVVLGFKSMMYCRPADFVVSFGKFRDVLTN